jgi:hypothetical protein
METRETLRRKHCEDCPDAVFHSTGSLIWVSCKHADGWRSINSQCVMVEKKGIQ